uniref:Uncharacterized protein n=2 Tax=Anguilla anguilla TaxID=7936 RepID=A0A0E9QAC9_ANGAN
MSPLSPAPLQCCSGRLTSFTGKINLAAGCRECAVHHLWPVFQDGARLDGVHTICRSGMAYRQTDGQTHRCGHMTSALLLVVVARVAVA